MDYLGDFIAGGVSVQHKFMTVNASGKPTTLGDSPTLRLYVNASVSGVASGLTLTTDFDTNTGLNHVSFLCTTSVTGVAAGGEYQCVIATGSVSGISMKGYPIFGFSLQNRVANANVTSISTNVGAVVTAVNTIMPARVTAQGIDIGAIVTACNTVVDANVTAITTNVGAIVTAFNTIANANVTSISTNVGAVVTASNINVGAVVTAINTIAPANVTTYSTAIPATVTACSTIVPANVTAMAAGIITFATFSANAIDNNALAASAVTEIQNGLAEATSLAAVAANVTNLQSRIPAALSGGRMVSDAQAIASVTVIGSGSGTDLWRGA